MDPQQNLFLLIPIVVTIKLQLLCFLWLGTFAWSAGDPARAASRRNLGLLTLLQLLALASASYCLWVVQQGVLHVQVPLAAMTMAVTAIICEGAYRAYERYGLRLTTKLWLFIVSIWLLVVTAVWIFSATVGPMRHG